MQKMKWQNRRFRIHSLVLFTFPPSDAAKMGPNGFDSPCEHRNSKENKSTMNVVTEHIHCRGEQYLVFVFVLLPTDEPYHCT